MLSAVLINPEATLNNYYPQDSVDFVAGSAVTMAFQITQSSKKATPWPSGERYVSPSTAIVTFTMNNNDATDFEVVGSFIDVGDRSLVSLSLSAAQTLNLQSGAITFTIDLLGDGTQILNGVILNVLHRVDTTVC